MLWELIQFSLHVQYQDEHKTVDNLGALLPPTIS